MSYIFLGVLVGIVLGAIPAYLHGNRVGNKIGTKLFDSKLKRLNDLSKDLKLEYQKVKDSIDSKSFIRKNEFYTYNIPKQIFNADLLLNIKNLSDYFDKNFKEDDIIEVEFICKVNKAWKKYVYSKGFYWTVDKEKLSKKTDKHDIYRNMISGNFNGSPKKVLGEILSNIQGVEPPMFDEQKIPVRSAPLLFEISGSCERKEDIKIDDIPKVYYPVFLYISPEEIDSITDVEKKVLARLEVEKFTTKEI